jgi:hypothetical protein
LSPFTKEMTSWFSDGMTGPADHGVISFVNGFNSLGIRNQR